MNLNLVYFGAVTTLEFGKNIVEKVWMLVGQRGVYFKDGPRLCRNNSRKGGLSDKFNKSSFIPLVCLLYQSLESF